MLWKHSLWWRIITLKIFKLQFGGARTKELRAGGRGWKRPKTGISKERDLKFMGLEKNKTPFYFFLLCSVLISNKNCIIFYFEQERKKIISWRKCAMKMRVFNQSSWSKKFLKDLFFLPSYRNYHPKLSILLHFYSIKKVYRLCFKKN